MNARKPRAGSAAPGYPLTPQAAATQDSSRTRHMRTPDGTSTRLDAGHRRRPTVQQPEPGPCRSEAAHMWTARQCGVLPYKKKIIVAQGSEPSNAVIDDTTPAHWVPGGMATTPGHLHPRGRVGKAAGSPGGGGSVGIVPRESLLYRSDSTACRTADGPGKSAGIASISVSLASSPSQYPEFRRSPILRKPAFS